ncbi:MAG: DMT family transporter [Hyphomicrobiaceae bacterium]
MSDAPNPVSDTVRLPTSGYLLLAFVTLFWGANWPAMKIALQELPIWWFRAMCVTAGAAGLLTISKLSGESLRVAHGDVYRMLLIALFAMLGWQVCSAYGVSLMPAGRASIIAFTMPVWAAILGAVMIDEPITMPKVVGLVLGVAGLGILIGDDLVVLGTAPIGAVFMFAAAVCWAIGTVLFKKYSWSTPISVLIGWQLAASAVPITIVAMATEPLPQFGALSREALLALSYVFALPMIFCQWAFFKVVSIFPATIAAMGTLAAPVVGVYSSALILDEPVGWQELVSLVLICAALASVLVLPNLARAR